MTKTLILISVLFLISCKREGQANVLKIDPKEALEEINLSEIVDSIKYIKLQTDANCIMGRVIRIIIKEKYIYAVDAGQQTVFVFDKNGRYVSKLNKHGRGPDEYQQMSHIFISDDEQYIEVMNFKKASKLLRYSNINFNLIDDKQSMPSVSSNSCRREGDVYYFACQQIENTFHGKPTNSDILVVRDGQVVKTIFDKNIVTNGVNFSVNSECFTFNDRNELFVSLMYNNTFYKLSNMDAYPFLTLDFGKYNIDPSIRLKSTKEQMEYNHQCVNVCLFPVLDINNSNIMVFTYNFKTSVKGMSFSHYIKLKNTNRVIHTKNIKNDLTPFPERILFCTYFGIGCEAWYKDYLVQIVQPANELIFNSPIDEKTFDGIGSIKATDNPIIMLMKLKKI